MVFFRRILRIIVGLIFIISAFVKAVDVKGFSFKLEEYFSPAVFNIAFLESLALPLAILVVTLECVLGISLLLKFRLKSTLIQLIMLCVFFAFLTFYSAYFDAVTDCGCFGDALKLTPWQSFGKDLILLAALIALYLMYRNNYKYSRGGLFRNITSAILGLFFGWLIYYGIAHEPLIDFRDYKIGTDLKSERQKIEASPSEFKTFYSLTNTKTGEQLKVNQDDYISKNYWKDTNWVIDKDKTTSEITKQGYASEILKFKIEDEVGNNVTEAITNAPKAILIFSYAPKEMDSTYLQQALLKMKAQNGAYILGVSTENNTFKTIKNALMDGTAIKTIARSNPFILTLQHGIIIDKSSLEDYINKK